MAESPITELGIAGFNACKALSTKFSNTPSIASRPSDMDRDSFVMGEGAGIVVLEELERRSVTLKYIEVLGYGLTGDAISLHPRQMETVVKGR